MDYISIREKRGVELVHEYSDKNARLVLDPTLLLEAEQWMQLEKVCKYSNKRPYIFCYLFGTQESYTKVINDIKDKTGFDVIIIPVNKRDLNPLYKQAVNAGPLEFLSLVRNAELVITDSFHATVFSLIFHKQFFTLLRDSDSEMSSMNSRLYSLLQLTGMESRLFNADSDCSLSMTKIDEMEFDKADSVINKYRMSSLEYLRTALGENHVKFM